MSGTCTVDPACINWPQPDLLLCDPCIDFTNTQHVALFNAAWQSVTQFLYDQTGCAWPGSCYLERIRPCVDYGCGCHPTTCPCVGCGRYTWMGLDDATCLPILDIAKVWIGPTHCNPEEQCLTPGDGVRLEWVAGSPRLVLEDSRGCCGRWPFQDLCRPVGEPCTWYVDVITGCPPPQYVLDGAAAMASELVKGCIQYGCRLPGNVTRRSFDGTTVDVDPERGVTLPLQMLQEVLDREVEPRGWFVGPSAVSFHATGRPVRVCDCPVRCELPSCSGCGCEGCDPASIAAAVIDAGVLV